MWQKSCSRTYRNLARDALWRAWTDVRGWPRWDKELEYTQLDGPFVPGVRFTLKPKAGPTVRMRLESLDPGQRFTDVALLPLARLYDAHEIEETPEGLRLTNTLTLEGPLAWLWRRLIAEDIASGLPAQLDALARHAAGG
jgi:hypothetical protein